MTAKNLPPVEYLRKRLRYEPETGKLFWLDCEEMSVQWRAKLAGKPALTALSHGYLHGAINGVKFAAHRVAWAIFYGECPTKQIDHINGVPSDNRIVNLRMVSNQENAKNTKMRTDNTSGVTGVCWDKREEKWMAHIGIDGKFKFLGHFKTLEEAASARAEASAKHGFSKRHGEKTA